jgi:hypothetical protein
MSPPPPLRARERKGRREEELLGEGNEINQVTGHKIYLPKQILYIHHMH